MTRVPYFFLSVLILTNCTNTKVEKGITNKNEFASGFSIFKQDTGFYTLKVFDPWQHAERMEYSYSFDYNSEKKENIHQFNNPVKRVVCLSVTHIAFIKALEMEHTIVGISNSSLVYDSAVRAGIENGRIVDIGYDQSINLELLSSLAPDIVFGYGVGAETEQLVKKLESMKIPVILIGEYLENHPLGRAEWIKPFGLVYNKIEQADSIFYSIEGRYKRAVRSTQNSKQVVVITGLPFRSQWYIPGGDSYFSVLISDAGGIYPWKENRSKSSFVVSPELIYTTGLEADIWINCGVAEKADEIRETDGRLTQLKPFINQTIFNNTKRSTSTGANDFWESGLLCPDLIIKDLNAIFKGQNSDSLVFYKSIFEK